MYVHCENIFSETNDFALLSEEIFVINVWIQKHVLRYSAKKLASPLESSELNSLLD